MPCFAENITENVTVVMYDHIVKDIISSQGNLKMKDRIRGNEYRYFTVCADRFEENIISGSFYNPYLVGGQTFNGVLDLILGIDGILNEMGNVQQGCSIRSFTRNEVAPHDMPNAEIPKCGAVATFNIKILFRQNASWQGTVTWMEGRAEESFRSVLELIYLMKSACEA